MLSIMKGEKTKRQKLCLMIVLFFLICGSIVVTMNKKSNGNSKETSIDKKKIWLADDISMEFVRINAGSFMMGAAEETGDEDEMPVHKVTISKPFYMGIYEVTQEQWNEVMPENPSKFIGDRNPVENVSWEECQTFLQKLEKKTGDQFALPTEAQWEYACRAGTDTRWFFGEDETQLGDYAWDETNSNKTTHPVGKKKSNPWGLYDIYGNVQEWCSDWYYGSYPREDEINPVGPSTGDSRVLRGGGWGELSIYLRSSYRNCNGQDCKNDGIGFRCIMLEQ